MEKTMKERKKERTKKIKFIFQVIFDDLAGEISADGHLLISNSKGQTLDVQKV